MSNLKKIYHDLVETIKKVIADEKGLGTTDRYIIRKPHLI